VRREMATDDPRRTRSICLPQPPRVAGPVGIMIRDQWGIFFFVPTSRASKGTLRGGAVAAACLMDGWIGRRRVVLSVTGPGV